ncbi:MAG: Fe-S cluster assembly ATPase SufC [Spirochaetia bacterium]|jgi:Fe-S cluster assembly ATP-binding protein
MAHHLQVKNLQANIGDKPILTGIDLDIRTGEVHALMGPNGSGKSTLANVLMGHPAYTVTGGTVTLDGEDYLALKASERALRGVFLAFQYPVEITGVTVGKFLKRAIELRQDGKSMNVTAYIKQLREAMTFMEMDQAFINRYLNQGFSGGEKKRMEVLQMLMLKPSLALLDETDSGLDIDALKVVSRGVNKLRGPDFGALIITHYQRILTQIVPDYVHIMYKGRIVTSGGKDLVTALEEKGYDWIREQYGIEEEAHEGAIASR